MKALQLARAHRERFPQEFLDYLPSNLHVYQAFEQEALAIAQRGYRHYSARTIVEVLRHHSALQQLCGAWKLNDHNTPYLARLFALANPERAYLFEFRAAKATKRRRESEATA